MMTVIPLVLLGIAAAEEQQRHIFPGPAPIPSRGCGKALSVPVGAPLNMILPVPEDEMLFNKFREYYLFLPKAWNNTEPLPLTVSFHGFYDEAIDLEKTDKLMAMSIQTGGSFIAVHPQGMMDTGTRTPQVPYPQRTWNCGGTVRAQPHSGSYTGPTCITANRTDVWGDYPCYLTCQMHGGCKDTCYSSTCANDVLFTQKLLDHLEDSYCIDRRRIHASGMSNGGMMAYQAGVSFSSRFASMVPVAGSALLGFWTPPKTPIALMDIHGTMDEVSHCQNPYTRTSVRMGAAADLILRYHCLADDPSKLLE